MLPTEITFKLAAASRVIDTMKTRVRKWNEKADPKDRNKVMERAQEIMTVETALLSASKDLQPIVVAESNTATYERGFEAARRRFSTPSHGIRDRRQVVFDNFGSPYNAANERLRSEHNARQAEKWEDHY
jgi:hypothetical protein